MADGRRDAGIGRYARQLAAALEGTPGLEVEPAVPAAPAWSEARPVRFAHAQRHVIAAAIGAHPDLVHGIGGEPVLGFPSARQVVTVHDVEMWRQPPAPGPAGAARRVYEGLLATRIRACAGVIAVSETTRDEAIATLGLEPCRVHVVPNGVSSVFSARPRVRDTRVAEAAGLDGGFVLWVGSLRAHDPRKGLDVLLEALELVPGAPPLALVGALGPEADRLAAEAWRRRVGLVLCGSVDDQDLASLYRRASVVVIASTHEGFGLTALETMASAAPLVATAAGNLPHLAGGVAELVPAGDPAALAGAIESVLTDPVRAARMRHAGVPRAAEYSWEQTASMTADVYREVAFHHRPPRR